RRRTSRAMAGMRSSTTSAASTESVVSSTFDTWAQAGDDATAPAWPAPPFGKFSCGPGPADALGPAPGFCPILGSSFWPVWPVLGRLGLGAHGVLTEPAIAVAGVGSNGTQPNRSKYTSVHACRLRLVSVYVLPFCALPLVKPIATRAGIPAARTSQAMAAEYCSQKPCRLIRKSTMSLPLVPTFVCWLYVNLFAREKKLKIAITLSYGVRASLTCCFTIASTWAFWLGSAVNFFWIGSFGDSGPTVRS